MNKYNFPCFILLLIICMSCEIKRKNECYLKVSDSIIRIPVDEDTKLPQLSVCIFEKNGTEFLSFQNDRKPEIQIFDLRKGRLIKKIVYDVQGDQGIVGGFIGYCIKDFSHIYIPSMYTNTLYVTDTLGRINQKIYFDKTDSGKRLLPVMLTSSVPLIVKESMFFIPQTINPMLQDKVIDESPICILIDTAKHLVNELPMKYLPLVTAKDMGTSAMLTGTTYAKCFNGKSFVYAFAYSDNIEKVSLNHINREEIKVKSEYANELKIPRSKFDDFQEILKEQCEYAAYGNIIYDQYRKIYYRLFYPQTELGVEKDYLELLHTGRKQFSIMILDENFKLLGETLFPEYTFNPNLYMVLKDGLYLGTNHIKSPKYSDDELCFQRIDLMKY